MTHQDNGKAFTLRLPEQIIEDIKSIRQQREALNAKEAQLLTELQVMYKELGEFLT
jgi:hypothetical protein